MFPSASKIMLKVRPALNQAEKPNPEQNPFRKDDLSSHTPVRGRRIELTHAIDVDWENHVPLAMRIFGTTKTQRSPLPNLSDYGFTETVQPPRTNRIVPMESRWCRFIRSIQSFSRIFLEPLVYATFVALTRIRNLYSSHGDIVSLILAGLAVFYVTNNYSRKNSPLIGTSCSYRALLVVIDPHDLPMVEPTISEIYFVVFATYKHTIISYSELHERA